MSELTDFERDQLKEVVNIGAGHASMALSKLVGKQVAISVPAAYIDHVEKMPALLGEPEGVMTAVLLKLLGDAPGMMLLLFPPESAMRLASLLTKTEEKPNHILDDMDRSALKEVGNILAGAAMNALSKFLDLNFLQSVPDTATDMLGSVVNSVLAEIGRSSDTILIFKVDFSIQDKKVDGQLFFLFDPQATGKILKATKGKLLG